ncbi:MAG: TetR/AcrR family transcriptional regulator [Clostridiales bacterium]|nr:TetR/AcrR family transcriptional regulator [Clostridiales bacterium]
MAKQEYKNSIQSKRKIASAYLNLLINNQNNLNVTEIVKLAGINRGTFYLHFDNIQSVAKYIENELAGNFKHIEQEFRLTEIDKTPELVLDKLNEILYKDIHYYQLIIQASTTENLMDKLKTIILNSIENNFKVMRYVTNYERFKMVVQYIVGGAIEVYINWLKGKLDCRLEDVRDFLSTIIKDGLKGCINYG